MIDLLLRFVDWAHSFLGDWIVILPWMVMAVLALLTAIGLDQLRRGRLLLALAIVGSVAATLVFILVVVFRSMSKAG